MKIKSFFLVATMLLGALTVSANDDVNTGIAIVPVKGSTIYKIVYKSETSGNVKINVYSPDADLIFTETIRNIDGFIQPLNFMGLRAGEYKVELIDARGKKTHIIRHRMPESESAAHVSKLQNEENKYLLSFTSRKPGERVTVRIYDGFGNLIHEEIRSEAGDFAKVYTLKTNFGNVTFEVLDSVGSVKTVKF